MRRFIAFYLFIILIALTVIFVPGLRPVAAEDGAVQFVMGKNFYYLNGNRQNMDAVTFAEKGRTYVPIRFLGEALGATVDWNNILRMVTLTKGDTVVYLVVGVNKVLVTDQSTSMGDNLTKFLSSATDIDAAPLVRDGRTYLPARFVAEAFGYQVDWDAGTGTVTVSKDGNVPPPPVVDADPTNPPIEYDDRGWPVIKVETAQKLFGPLVPPDELIGNGTWVALKWKSRDVLLNPEIKLNTKTMMNELVGGTLLKDYLPAPLGERYGYYEDRNGIMVKGPETYYPLKEMLLFGGFPEQNIFWNPQTKTMVIYGSHFFNDDYYSVTKVVAGQELRRKNLVPAPLVENGSLLISDADFHYISGKAYRDGSVPLHGGWFPGDLKLFK